MNLIQVDVFCGGKLTNKELACITVLYICKSTRRSYVAVKCTELSMTPNKHRNFLSSIVTLVAIIKLYIIIL